MIRQKNDPHQIDPQYDWEESDKLIAATLSFETEQHYLELARNIRAELMATPLHGDELFMKRIALETSFLRGKYELLMELVEQSREAKVQANLI